MQRPRTRKTGNKARKRQKPQKQAEATDRAELDQSSIVKGTQRTQDAERKRSASSKCRLRDRDDMSKLASLEQTMRVQNRELLERCCALRAEIYTLKAQLVQHTGCNCVLIQSYIANEADKWTIKLLGGPEAPLSSSSAQTAQTLMTNSAAATAPDLQAGGDTSAAAIPIPIPMQSPMMVLPG